MIEDIITVSVIVLVGLLANGMIAWVIRLTGEAIHLADTHVSRVPYCNAHLFLSLSPWM